MISKVETNSSTQDNYMFGALRQIIVVLATNIQTTSKNIAPCEFQNWLTCALSTKNVLCDA